MGGGDEGRRRRGRWWWSVNGERWEGKGGCGERRSQGGKGREEQATHLKGKIEVAKRARDLPPSMPLSPPHDAHSHSEQ